MGGKKWLAYVEIIMETAFSQSTRGENGVTLITSKKEGKKNEREEYNIYYIIIYVFAGIVKTVHLCWL